MIRVATRLRAGTLSGSESRKQVSLLPAPRQRYLSHSDEDANHNAYGDACRRAEAVGKERAAGHTGEARCIVYMAATGSREAA
jgi:hypothetical protein